MKLRLDLRPFRLACAILPAISAQASPPIYLGGTITSTGGQTYSSAVILTNNTLVTSTGGGSITFASTVDGAYSLTVDTAGTTTFGGTVGAVTPLTSLTTGTTALNGGTVTTMGDQSYDGPVILGANDVLIGESVTFASTVDGAYSLTIVDPTAFDGVVGGVVQLTSLEIGGTTALNCGLVATRGGQNYSGAVLLVSNTTLQSTMLELAWVIGDGNNLTLNNSGLATLSGPVSGVNTLTVANSTGTLMVDNTISAGSVSDNEDTTLNGIDGSETISTTGDQDYSGAVALGANTALNAVNGTTAAYGTIELAGVTGNNYNLTLNNSGLATLNGAVIGVTQLTVNGSGVLAANSTISAGSVNVMTSATLGGNGTINAPVTVHAGGALSLGLSIGSLIISNSLALSGTAFMKLNASSQTNDLVRGMTSIAYGGTLSVTNLAGTLAAGDTFRLFAASNYSGTFASLQLPTLGSGLVWNSSNLSTNGSITVDVAPPSLITGIAVPGLNTVRLTATGVPNQLYYLWASANVTLPGSQWWLLGSTNATSEGAIAFVDPTATNSQRFYRLAQ